MKHGKVARVAQGQLEVEAFFMNKGWAKDADTSGTRTCEYSVQSLPNDRVVEFATM